MDGQPPRGGGGGGDTGALERVEQSTAIARSRGERRRVGLLVGEQAQSRSRHDVSAGPESGQCRQIVRADSDQGLRRVG